jgi:hypothetical protein
MRTVLLLLAVQAVIGTFDTLWYHEFKGRLPARPEAARELRLHAGRDVVYAAVFLTLPWLAWQGAWAYVLAAGLAAEVVVTCLDFVTEDRVRRVSPGERVTHAVMGVVYGAMLAQLVPVLLDWAAAPTAFAAMTYDLPVAVKAALTLGGAGTLLSGARDLYASTGRRGAAWPWPPAVAGA